MASGCRVFSGHKPGNVFPDQIEFKVDDGPGDNGLDVGVPEGVGNDRDVEAGLFYVENGEAGTVQGDGTFFDHQVAEFPGKFKTKFPTSVEFHAFDTSGGGVDMALDYMSVKPAIDWHATFEVDEVAGLPGIKIGLFKRFFDSGHAVGVFADFLHSQADAVMGDALVYGEVRGERGFDPEHAVGAVGFHGFYRAECFDDSGEHGFEIRKNWRRLYGIIEKYRTFANRK